MHGEVQGSSGLLNHVIRHLGSFGLSLLPSSACDFLPSRSKILAVLVGIPSALQAAEGRAQGKSLFFTRFLYHSLRRRSLYQGLLIACCWPESSHMHMHEHTPTHASPTSSLGIHTKSLLSRHCSRERQERMELEWLSSKPNYGICIAGHGEKV